jgi:predicted AAA+ superfamily ATPase
LEYIKFGGYPAVVMEKDVEKKFVMFDNLIKDYLLKDVSVFLKENELLKFKQFLKLVSLNI